jgi:ketosteroid isomerase-like protein
VRFFSLFAAVLILVASLNFTRAQTGSDSDQILAAEHTWANAAVERKIDTFAKYLSDDYVLIVVNASPGKKSEFELTNKPKWVEMLRSGREKYEAVEIHNLKILVNGDVATVTGEYSQKGTRDDKDITDAGLYVDTWIKRNGQWRLVSSVFP